MKKLLITGYMRSGTTLLANFINTQRNCVVYRDFLRTIFKTSDALSIKSFLVPLKEREKNILLSNLKAESWSIGSNMMDEIDKNFSNLKELYYKSLIKISERSSCELVGTKVTAVGEWLPRLIKETEVKILYLYRDLRDVMLSAKNRFSWYKPIEFMLSCKNDIENALKINSKKLYLIRFEDFVQDPQNVAKRLSDFLNLEINVELQSLKDRKIEWINNSAFHDINKPFDEKACFRWKDNVESKEVKYCEILNPDILVKIGYDLSSNKFSLFDRMNAWKAYLKYKVKNLIKGLFLIFK